MVQCANCKGRHSANLNRFTQKYKADINVQRNKTPNKDKNKMVEHNNKQNKVFDKSTPSLGETSSNSILASPDLDIRMDLEPESCVKKKKKEGSDNDKISKKTNHSEKF